MGVTSAQDFSNTIFIGDSNSDSGRFHYLPNPTSGSTHTPGAYTTSPGLMWSESLGSRFGITVTPSSAPGGGNNYAAGGATVSTANGGEGNAIYTNEWSASAQVNAYLASTGGIADPNALYTVYIGNNDLHSWFNLAPALPNLVDATVAGGSANPLNLSQRQAALVVLGNQTAALVQQLSAAGARYILVPNSITLNTQAAANAVNYTGTTGVDWDVGVANAVQLYNSTMWSGITAQGINFIPADFNGAANYVILNAARFGITNTDWSAPVCGSVASIDCTSANWVSGRTPYNSLFADTNGHLAAVGQQIQADYVYDLLVAPGQISMLANQALQNQTNLNNSYLSQISYSFRGRSPETVGTWALGSVQQINIKNDPIRSDGTPYTGTVGVDYQLNENTLIGGFVGYGRSQVSFGSSLGGFTQSGTQVGGYLGFKTNAIWGSGLIAYNYLDNNVNRVTPIGITSFSNTSNIKGSNMSVAVQIGYNLECGIINHGPVVGYSYINTHVDGFTEAGNFNSLQFSSQNINSHVGSIGYQIQSTVGSWSSYLKASYNDRLENLDRSVTTTLTSVSAPSYNLPAATIGDNWFDVMAGVGYQIDEKTSIRANFTQQVSQHDVSSYGATMSFNTSF